MLVPEIPEWRRLELAPAAVAATLSGCVERLRATAEVSRGRLGLIGFSFGAPQVAMAAGQGDLAGELGGIDLFGGYCSLERTMKCQLTGEHEWGGLEHRLDPDPFGGWVVGGNYLNRVPGLGGSGDVQVALRRLARAASGQRIPAWDPRHDALIRDLRGALPASKRPVFDLFATPSTESLGALDERRALATELAAACRHADPLLDPGTVLGSVALPTRLLHGRGDRLIPFTEALRLQRSLPDDACRDTTVTGLFNHSADAAPDGFARRTRERVILFEAIRGMINLV